MSNIKIRPCPHCGGNACLTSNYSYKRRCYFIVVRCDICGAQGKTYADNIDPAENEWVLDSCDDAIKAWNMRTYSAPD